MKPCRDCSQPASPAARSCPHCGIMNPVHQWVALPDGSHLTARAAPDPVAAAAALRAGFGSALPMPAPAAPRPIARPAAPRPAAVVPDSGPEVDAIRQCSTIFFWLAGINAAAGYFLGGGYILEGATMAVLSLALRRYNSRVAAVLLVLYAVLTILTKLQLMMAGAGFRPGWIWLWVLVTGAAFKAAVATFKLRQPQLATA
jgi:hypothetical protein